MSAPASPPPPLHGRNLAIAAIALSLATFMNVLDTTIANVSIPAISGNVGVSPNQGTWVITSFAVANAVGVPLTGWLAQRFGSVHLFVASVLLFVTASTLCGLSTNLSMLIFFRIIQGLVAGPMIPMSQALLLQSFPRERAGMALAVWSMTTLVAPVVGPVLGGWLTDNLSWPWIFYINIPVGLIAAWAVWLTLRHRESPKVKRPVDRVGLALLVVWVGSLQLMLDKGRELDWFNSGTILLLAVAALIGFCFFIAWELTETHPIVDLSFFRRRSFTVGGVALAFGYGLFFGNVVLLPLWLQQFMGYTATWAGLVMAPTGIVAVIFTPLVGRYLHDTDPRMLSSVSFLIFGIVSLMRAEFTADADLWTIVLPQLLQGVAMAMFFVPMTTIILSGIPHTAVPPASGLSNFLRITAGAFGASIATTFWDNRASLHHARLAEHVNAYDPATALAAQGLAGNGLGFGEALGVIEREVTRQAFILSADDFFWISGMLFFMVVPLLWLATLSRGGPPTPVVAAE